MDSFDIMSDFKGRILRGAKFFLVALLGVLLLGSLFGGSDRGSDKPRDMINFSGRGEVSAVPDVANIYFTIEREAKTAREAQAQVAEVEKKALAFLRESGVADKDFKATNASFSPKYEYIYDTKAPTICVYPYDCPPRPGRSVITGYTASESVSVKVRRVDDVGKIIEGLGALEVSNLSGPDFAIDDEEALKAEARRKAITDAKAKARMLAKDLGVRLGKITAFSEGGDYHPTPMYKMMAVSEDASGVPPRAELPRGENTITSSVTITYELK